MDNPETITKLLRRWKVEGDSAAEEELFVVVERQLQQMAERSLSRNSGFSHKLDPRELVHEAYLALRDYPIVTANRGPFFALMARAMRNVLMDIARRDRAAKRPATRFRVVDTGVMDRASVPAGVDVFDFYDAIDALHAIDANQAKAIEWSVLGYTTAEISEEVRRSTASVTRDLRHARTFLAQRLELGASWIQV
ncbi:MAG: ECF-type sigma factor [Vicinamibacterales bacterium]